MGVAGQPRRLGGVLFVTRIDSRIRLTTRTAAVTELMKKWRSLRSIEPKRLRRRRADLVMGRRQGSDDTTSEALHSKLARRDLAAKLLWALRTSG
jgi:hypothetical protein